MMGFLQTLQTLQTCKRIFLTAVIALPAMATANHWIETPKAYRLELHSTGPAAEDNKNSCNWEKRSTCCSSSTNNRWDFSESGAVALPSPPPAPCDQSVILVARDNGNILSVNLATGSTAIINTSPFTSGNLNALAANADNSLVYYCRDKIVYYWNPLTNLQDTVVNLAGFIGANESLSSGGGEYFNGYLYLGTESGNPGTSPRIWRVKLKNDGTSTVGLPQNLNVPVPSYLSWGDLIATAQGGHVILYGMAASTYSHFFKYNVNTGVYTTIRNDLPTEMQLGVDIDGNTWAGTLSSGTIQKIDRTTGNFYGTAINFGGKIWDLTGPINCPQEVEICGNGIDDDTDGYPDNQDQECLCPVISPVGSTTVSVCEGQSVTFNVTSNAPNPPYSYIEFYRFDTQQSNPYLSAAPKVWLGEFTNTNGSGSISSSDFPVMGASDVTYYIYGCVKPEPQNPATCFPLVEYVLTVKPSPDVNAGPDATLCGGAAVTLTASASNGVTPYSFSWNNGLGAGASKTVNPASSTTYSVTATAANGCAGSDNVVVSINPAPVASAGANQTICNGNTALLTASATGGTTPYTFSWSHGLGTGASKSVSPPSTTTYTVTVSSPNGCVSTSSVTVTVNNCIENCTNGQDDNGNGLTDCADPACQPTAELEEDYFCICIGTSADLAASATGGVQPYTFSWSHGLGAGANKTVTPPVTTDYVVSVSAAGGCTDTAHVHVAVLPCPEECENGIDDDGDGLADCLDPDCSAVAAPALADDYYTICPGTVFRERVTYNDGNLVDPAFSIFSQPAHGSVVIDATGKFTYTPTVNNFCGTETFMYSACNQSAGCCAYATVTLNLGDQSPPTLLNIPSDITVSCDETVPSPPQVLAFDACPGIFIEYDETSEEYAIGGCQSYVVTRTWTARDLCGNESAGSQIINVQDLEAPELFRLYTLANGRRLFAGVSENTTSNWKYIAFPAPFSTPPVVFAQVNSDAEATAVIVRLRNVTTHGFEMMLAEQENSDGNHAAERVAWLAMEPGSLPNLKAGTMTGLNHTLQTLNFGQTFGAPPHFLGMVQTWNEADPVVIRTSSLTANGLGWYLEEETSKDSETSHTAETAAWLAMEPGSLITDENGDFIGETGNIILTNAWTTIPFSRKYTRPVILFGGLSENDGDPVTVRVRNVTQSGFSVRLQEWGYQDGTHGAEGVSYLIVEGSLPADVGSYCTQFSRFQNGINVFAHDNCEDQTEFDYDEQSNMKSTGMEYQRTWSAADACGNTHYYSRTDTCTIAAVRLKMMLFGSLLNSGNSPLMRDDLRVKNRIPEEEPYSTSIGFQHKGRGGGETIEPAALTAAGNNAIADWVFVELRDSATRAVLATTSAILERDGNVTTAQGDSMIFFTGIPEGEYYISVRHRNHIGLMTQETWYLTSDHPPLLDFTDPMTSVQGGLQAGKFVNNLRTLWAGDMNGDRRVIYQGPNNDIFFLFSKVLADENNTSFLSNYISQGYDREDFNLDGNTIYQGPGNERAMLLYNTVLLHPGNVNNLANYIVRDALP